MNLLKRFLFVVLGAIVSVGKASAVDFVLKESNMDTTYNYGHFGITSLTEDTWNSIGVGGVATLAGGIDGLQGTFGDEGSIVLLVVNGVTKEGNPITEIEICPMQIQSANKEGRQLNWIRIFNRGNCIKFYADNASSCDSVDYTKKWSNIGVLKSGGTELTKAIGSYTGEQKDWKKADIKLFAVEKILPHGVLVTGVKVETKSFKGSKEQEENGGCAKGTVCSTIASLAKKSGNRLFCAKGYKKNSAGTDCVANTSEPNGCKVSEADMLNNLCSGYSRTVYQRSPESWQLAASADNSSCYVYYCPNTKYGFKSTSDHTCVKCPNRSGQQKNGLCAPPCEIGKSYSVSDYQKDGSCVDDTAYSKTDMMYGAGKTKNSQSFENSCWTIIDDYKSCVEKGGQNKSE